jgi:hypothetical protein
MATTASRISRKPLTFEEVEWLDEAEVADEIFNLLPRGLRELSEARILEIETFFGPGGKCSAVQIDKRFARGVGSTFST